MLRHAIALALPLGLATCVAPPGGEGQEPAGSAAPTAAAPGVRLAWLSLTAPFQGPTRFLTLERNGELTAVEASGPNLETAVLRAVRQGRLPGEETEEVFTALLDADWESWPRPSGEEPIEESRELMVLALAAEDDGRGPRDLYREDLAPTLRSTVDRLLTVAGDLDLAPGGGVVSAQVVTPDRRRRLQEDPRGFYRFLDLDRESLDGVPGLASALAFPGAVFLTSADEAARLEGWLRQSDPQSLGDTLFLSLVGVEEPGHHQVHFKRWR